MFQCTWSNAGDRVACANEPDGRLVVAGQRGENPRYITQAGADESLAPAWSLDDKLIAFSRGNGEFLDGAASIGNIAPSSLWVVRAEGGTPVKVSGDSHLNMAPVWTPDGSLLFVSSLGGTRDIYMQRLSGDLRARGAPIRLTTGLNPHTISLSRDGKTLAYSVFNTVANIWTATAQGSAVANAAAARPVTSGNQTIERGFVSPDGKWLAYDSNLNGKQDIYKVPIAGGDPQQLTKNDVDDFHPRWSPDGNEIAFHSVKNGNRDIIVMDASGANVRAVAEGPADQRAPVWLPGGGIVYVQLPDSIFTIHRRGTTWQKPVFLFKSNLASFSPDGRWLFRAERQGTMCSECPAGAYLMASDGSGRRHIPTPVINRVTRGRRAFGWSRDSRHLYVSAYERDGTTSIWQLPLNGDLERRVLHFIDPSRQIYLPAVDVHGENFYFTIGDRQSDIWVMDLKKQ